MRGQERGMEFIRHSAVETERESENKQSEGEMKKKLESFQKQKMHSRSSCRGERIKENIGTCRPKLDMG